MFLQPLVTRAELEQWPFSYCYVETDGERLASFADTPTLSALYVNSDAVKRKWLSVMSCLTFALHLPVDIEDTTVQGLISEIRAANGLAGWKCPNSVRPYQAVAQEVMVPLGWSTMSLADKQSMEEYLQLCLNAAVIGSEVSNNMDSVSQRLDATTGRRLFATMQDLINPQSQVIVDAISKVTNPDIAKELRAENFVSQASAVQDYLS